MGSEREVTDRSRSFIVAGVGAAVCSILLAAVAGPPYASLEHLSPWLVTFAVGLFGALFATPFAIHARAGGELEEDDRWERALLLWGAVALAVLVLGALGGAMAGFEADSLVGSLSLVMVIEAMLVLATLVAWLLSN